jgi:hypothetical protein
MVSKKAVLWQLLQMTLIHGFSFITASQMLLTSLQERLIFLLKEHVVMALAASKKRNLLPEMLLLVDIIWTSVELNNGKHPC